MGDLGACTVGRLARRAGVSRATLLYYDRVGLLRPSGRSLSGYRLYGEVEAQRLEAIRRYRALGLGVVEIRQLLAAGGGRTAGILEGRLAALDREIGRLREQQRVIVRLLAERGRRRRGRALDKSRWVAVFRAAGVSEEAMERWHVEFERAEPAGHQDFLESIGLSEGEIARIRGRARAGA